VKVVVAGAVATAGVVKLGVGTVSTDGELRLGCLNWKKG